jgi:hypothetical protein
LIFARQICSLAVGIAVAVEVIGDGFIVAFGSALGVGGTSGTLKVEIGSAVGKGKGVSEGSDVIVCRVVEVSGVIVGVDIIGLVGGIAVAEAIS